MRTAFRFSGLWSRGQRLGAVAAVVIFGLGAGAAPARAGFGTDLTGELTTGLAARLPASVDTVSAGGVLAGHRMWAFGIANNTAATVGSPTVTVRSGLAPSILSPFDEGSQSVTGPPLTSLPFVLSQPSLAPGSKFCCTGLVSSLALNQAPGFNLSRSVVPSTIAPGGTVQIAAVTVTQTLSNPYFKLGIGSFAPGVTVLGASGPANLGPGESVRIFPGPIGAAFVVNAAPGVAHTFTVVLGVPNATGSPFVSKPQVGILVAGQPEPPAFGAGSAVTIAEPTLDGPVLGGGLVTYSAAGPFSWAITLDHGFVEVLLEGIAPSRCLQNSQGDQNQQQNSQGCANP